MEHKLFSNLFVFEMANNHQGDLNHGLEIIHQIGKIAREKNIKASVKLQYRDLDTILHSDMKNDKNNKQAKRFLDTKLTEKEFLTLVQAIKDENMLAMCTPFDEKSVELCINHNMDILKVASCSCLDWPLMEAVAKAKKPVIISTGGVLTKDIDKIYNFATHREMDFALMHCVSIYPAPQESLHISYIQRMIQRYRNITIGYSGHEDPNDLIVPMLCVACGAKMFERHVGIEKEGVPLNAYSSCPEQFSAWVDSILNAKQICGDPSLDKTVSKSESDALHGLMRGVYAKRDLQKNSILNSKDVYFALPCSELQLTSGEFKHGMQIANEYKINNPIVEKPIQNAALKLREHVHKIKAMLFEAGIMVGNQFELELSHHFGVERFSEVGVAIISIINRQYCKKLLVVLPEQKHPLHMHKIKEETFQVLYGELELVIEDKTNHLYPGDIATVLPNQIHSFASKTGCVFEEVSTTHYRNDSFYEDESISRKDPMERKTILKNW